MMTGAALSDRQLGAVRDAATKAYDKLRWYVGDNEVMRVELYYLARDSYLEGMRQNEGAGQ